MIAATDVRDRAEAGGKAHALAALRDVVPDIPPWFVVRPEAFAATVGHERARAVAEDGADVGDPDLGGGLRGALDDALRSICPDGAPVAVRSSAVEEDSATASFAGQLESFLGVALEDVPRRVVDVWRSGFSERVRRYRREKRLSGPPRAPAVLVQRMVRADVSGIAFGRDPVGGDPDVCVVSATRGLGDQLVAGEVEGTTYRVAGDRVEVTGGDEPGPLSGAQVRAVADLVRRTGAALGGPQDIEWAFEDGRLFLLQSRPITTAAVREGTVALWDNSNIVESYGGVTSPLTFSFARHAYAGVYRGFLRNLGVPRGRIAAEAELLHHLLGRIRGRIYYDLLNWYRLLALLPGFDVTRRSLDQMLGIRRRLPPDLLETVRPRPAPGPAAFARSFAAIVLGRLTLRRRSDRFRERLDAALEVPVARVETMRLDELCAHYRDLERALLDRWDAPVLNDFYCMVAFSVSRRLFRRWGRFDGRALHGELMQNDGGVVSTEPARRIREMADLASGDPALAEALAQGDWRAAVERHPALRAALDTYVARFGDRCVQELKLESPTLYDDPTTLVCTVGHLATHGGGTAPAPPRRDVRTELRRLFRGRPVRRLVATALAAEARRRVRDRENLRFERTRVFGRVRRIFVEMGRRLADEGRLDAADDVFHLEMDELLAAVEGTLTTSDLRGLAALRRRETERLRAEPDPPGRFVTRGAVLGAVLEPVPPGPEDEVADDDPSERRGLACGPGIAVGKARVIDDPTGRSLAPGEVLVARQTDPGWVLLFAGAAGIVVERGSLLSHSAIVARELGIPAVVSVPGVTEWLRDGDRVEVDGSHGIVRRLEDA